MGVHFEHGCTFKGQFCFYKRKSAYAETNIDTFPAHKEKHTYKSHYTTSF